MKFRIPRRNAFPNRGNQRRNSRRLRLVETLEDRRVLDAVPFLATPVIEGGLGRSQQVEAVDLDGDGDLDAVALSGNGIATLTNDGAGNFGDLMEVSDRIPRDARAMDIGDVDNDGDIDVVVGSIAALANPDDPDSQDEISVSLFLNDGSGNLSLGAPIATAATTGFADAIDIADVNGDGALDIVTIERGNQDPEFIIDPGRFLVFFNNGGDDAGTFADPVDLEFILESEPAAVHVMDINGDGMNDVVGSASYGYTHSLFWWTQNGDGTFTKSADVVTQAGPRYMDSADIDGDGDLDLVVPEQGNPDANHPDQSGDRIMLYTNDGTGFTSATSLLDNINGVERTLFRDMDGDGDADVVATADSANVVIILPNEGGLFNSIEVVNDLTPQASGLSVGDLDGDSDVDILTTSQFHATVNQHTNNGDGTWTTMELTGPNAISPEASLLADFDGDGDLDVLGMSVFDFELAWYENTDGEGTFDTRDQNIITDLTLSPARRQLWWHIETGDMDNDGDIDVITSEPYDRQLLWYPNDGNGNFFDPVVMGVEGAGVVEFEVADMDADGDDDVIAGHAFDSHLVMYVNDGTGEFTPIFISDTADTITAEISSGDIDGDGDLDVLVGDNARYINTSVTWYEQIQMEDGTILFDAVQAVETLAGEFQGVEDTALVDMDGDGDLDAVVASYDDRNLDDSVIRWYENTDGKGTFSATENQIGTQFFVSELEFADVDKDGDVDVVSSNSRTEALEWFDNQGDGTFVPIVIEEGVDTSGTGGTVMLIDTGDINGDGRIDLVMPQTEDDRIVAYLSQFDPFDVNTDGEVNSDDADLVCANIHTPAGMGDVNEDGEVNIDDMAAILELIGSLSGDSNYDGTFGTPDLVTVFAAGEYEDGVAGNSTFREGDWNCSGDFDTNDLVFVFSQGTFDPLAAVAAPSGIVAGAIDQLDSTNDEADAIQDDAVHDDPAAKGPAVLDAVNVEQIFAAGDRASGVTEIELDELEV